MGSDGSGHSRTPRRAGRPALDVLVGDARGRPLRMSGLSSWLRRVAPARARGRIGIALVSNARIRSLNLAYRGLDYPTDVLSFPDAGEPVAAASSGDRATAARWLGEIVIATGVARRQARTAGHSELTELRVLALHGLLHLLGYDHEQDTGRMRRVEQRLRRKGGLREGLIERAR
jgi:probable rRNA maturation factor